MTASQSCFATAKFCCVTVCFRTKTIGWMLILATLSISTIQADPVGIDAGRWRSEKLKTLAEKTREAQSDDDRLELDARQTWLNGWQPGQMNTEPAESEADKSLVDEPLLAELELPKGIRAAVWKGMIKSQAALLEIDTREQRKGQLEAIIEKASELEKLLANQFSPSDQQLPAQTGWALAYTRYRLGRALAYRELPVVRERWPIEDAGRYEKRLLAVYQRLVSQTKRVRPEFILLEDRILRRAGKKGRALQLLEEHQGVIDRKWYLKKRRDLLQELGWTPPFQEASRIYREAGYDD